MAEKIIITIKDGIAPTKALGLVACVINQGKISKSGEIIQYCFVTTFNPDILVYARPKYNSKSDSFIVERDNKPKR